MRSHDLKPYYSSQPLVAPLWIIAVCMVLWTAAGIVWEYRAEKAMYAMGVLSDEWRKPPPAIPPERK